ncbi:MAG: hypothetical protein WCW26_04310 [Candidatus Buchananbacteria bacterium]
MQIKKTFGQEKYKKLLIIFLAVLIFAGSFLVHYLPVLVKGYSPAICTDNLILARNYYLTGQKTIENESGVYLSTDLIKENGGIAATTENELTPIIYSQLFRVFGFLPDLPLYISLICFSLILVLLFLLFNKMFNLSVALLAVGFGLLVPIFWWGSVYLGFYEFALLFFVLGFFIYFYPKQPSYFHLIFASLFFGLAALCRNAFLISFLAILIFDFFKNRSIKKSVVFVLPFAAIVGLVFGLEVFAGSNLYLSPKKVEAFSYYTHLFPDPYTYHFEAESYLAEIKDNAKGDIAGMIVDRGDYNFSEYLQKRGEILINSVNYYLRQLISLTILGGPITLLFVIFGFYFLQKENKKLFYFFGFWFSFLAFFLLFLKTSNWDHLLEILPLISLTGGLGVYYCLQSIYHWETDKNKSLILTIILVIAVFGNLFGLSKIMFSREYGGQNLVVKAQSIINGLKAANLDSKKDVVAIGIHPGLSGVLNYYTDKNYIYFDPETIIRLTKENKLKEGFDYFGVTAIAGFSDEIMATAANQTKVLIIKNQ